MLSRHRLPSATTTCYIIDPVPAIEDLLSAKRTAVKALEEEQRRLQSADDDTDAVRQAVDTAWSAAAGGIALAHADDDPSFRRTLTRILDDRISRKRDHELLAEWKKAGTSRALDGEPAAMAASKDDVNVRRRRKAARKRELETLSPTELLETLEQAETNQRQHEEDVASARARLAATAGDIRSRDRHWRVVVGVSVLTQAAKVPDFRRELDRLFTRRIADKDRPLLDRWRNQDASPVAAPPADASPVVAAPPAESAIPGWVPRKLPDKEWGAALHKPAHRDLPPDLVGLSIEVTPRKGGPWVTKITEVIEAGDDRILVRTEGHPVFPSPAGNAAATPLPDADGDGVGVKEEASPLSESET